MNLFDLFATINLDSSAYEAGLSDAEKTTESFGSKLGNGLQKASKVAVAAVGAVSAAGVALTTALVKSASDLAAYGDNIDKMSQKLGMTSDAYQEWDAIMQHSGASIESMTSAMKTMASAAETDSDAFKKLGISQEEIASLSQEELFSKVISALQNMEEGTERTYLASKLLGRGATELGALLNTSAEETEAMRQRVHDLGGVMSEDAVKSAAKFQDTLQDMKTAFSGIKRGISADMLPGLTSLMEGFTSLIIGEEGAEEALQSGLDSFATAVQNGLQKIASIGEKILPLLVGSLTENLPTLASFVIDGMQFITETLVENAPLLISSIVSILQMMGQGIAENLPVITESVTTAISEIAVMLSDPEQLAALLGTVLTIMQTMATAIIENVPVLIETAMQVIDNLIAFITENLPVFIDAAIEIMEALAQGLVNAIPELISKAPVIINKLTDALLKLIPKIVSTGVTLISSLVQNLSTIISNIVSKIPTIINSIVNMVTSLVPKLVDAGITLFTALVNAMPTIITTIVDKLPEIIDNIVNGLFKMLPTIVDAGIKLLTALVENLPKIISTIVSKLPQIISAIVNGIKNAIPQIVNVGSQLIQGLWQGISNVAEWLRQKISGFFGGVVQSIKNFFGIHSPSKVFAEIGEMLDKGLAKGVEDYAGLAVDAAEDMAEDVFDATDRDFNFKAVGDNSVIGGAGKSVVINVYGAEGQDVEELAEVISQKIAFNYTQEMAVFA